MDNNNKVVEKLKRKAASLDTGIEIMQAGDVRHIVVNMAKASFKGVRWTSLSEPEKKNFEDLLYLSNVGKGNPSITYTV